MRNSHTTALIHTRQYKDTKILIKEIRKAVEKETGLTFSELKKKYSEQTLFYKVLRCVNTTKKVVCKAFDINIDNACWYKRDYEKIGLLVQSVDEVKCPYSVCMAHLLSTNEKMFAELTKSNTNQLKLFK